MAPTKRRSSSATGPPPANNLLAALPADEYARLAPTLGITSLKLKRFLHKPGEAIDTVYFPGGGFVSVVTVLKDGGMVEVATIGREGMLGLSTIYDGDLTPAASMVQAETDVCYTMSAKAFRQEMDRRGAFYDLLTRYGQALVGFIMQSTACNAVHSVEQRLSRWLLLAHDRVETDDFPLTQEFAAMMLGTSRPTVTVVAGTLQKAGLITYHRGHITIVNRKNLESASCECYQTATEILKTVAALSRPETMNAQSISYTDVFIVGAAPTLALGFRVGARCWPARGPEGARQTPHVRVSPFSAHPLLRSARPPVASTPLGRPFGASSVSELNDT